MIIYISGPMSKLPNYNRAAFFAAEARLVADGHIVLNPAYNPTGLTHDQYIHIAKAMIDVADAIYLLRGWKDSRGAIEEIAHAQPQHMKYLWEWEDEK